MSAMDFLLPIQLGSYQSALPVPRILRLCNHLQNAGATTYILGLQLSTFIFYNKQTENAGGIGGFSLPPAVISFCLPNSGLMVRYEPYYIFREDGECIDFGMKPNFTIEEDESIEWWLWKQEYGLVENQSAHSRDFSRELADKEKFR